MKLQLFTVNPFQQNTYLLYTETKAILFDAGFSNEAEHQQLKAFLDTKGLNLEAVYLTHAHIDHVIGLQRVVDDYHIPVYLHDEDRSFIDGFQQHAAMFGVKVKPITTEIHSLESGEMTWEGITIEKRFTPGHAPGHISFYIPEMESVIAGDTLFEMSIGRTDLPGGDFEILSRSIKSELYSLPENTTVYPGHGPSTTIGREKTHNPFVKA